MVMENARLLREESSTRKRIIKGFAAIERDLELDFIPNALKATMYHI